MLEQRRALSCGPQSRNDQPPPARTAHAGRMTGDRSSIECDDGAPVVGLWIVPEAGTPLSGPAAPVRHRPGPSSRSDHRLIATGPSLALPGAGEPAALSVGTALACAW